MRRLDRRVGPFFRGQGGFTFIEIITVLLILGAISYFAATRLFMDDTPTQRGEFELLKNHLRYAQSRSMNSEASPGYTKVWGIKFGTATTYWLYNEAEGVDLVKRLPGVETADGKAVLNNVQVAGSPIVLGFDPFGSPGIMTVTLTVQQKGGGSTVGTIMVTKNTGFIP